VNRLGFFFSIVGGYIALLAIVALFALAIAGLWWLDDNNHELWLIIVLPLITLGGVGMWKTRHNGGNKNG
jgi:hypothetical protein